jgi:3-isopropylmalate/(R)-2-methylmalate dehydratase small subunit
VVSDAYLRKLLDIVEKNPSKPIVVDLEQQVIEVGGMKESFDINLYKKTCLINGYDDIDYLLSLRKDIKEFDLAHSA